MKFVSFVAAAAAAVGMASAAASDDDSHVPYIYIIRHAEKNKDGTISAQGKQREQCLIDVFGSDSDYNIQYIMTQTPHDGNPTSQRPYNTTLPLANSLGITIDTPCELNDHECAADAALAYTGPGNLLIAWEHDNLPGVCNAIAGADCEKYPSSHFDWIYNLPDPFTDVTITSEDCPGLDD